MRSFSSFLSEAHVPAPPESKYAAVSKRLEKLRRHAESGDFDAVRAHEPKSAEDRDYKTALLAHEARSAKPGRVELQRVRNRAHADELLTRFSNEHGRTRHGQAGNQWGAHHDEIESALTSGYKNKHVAIRDGKVVGAVAYGDHFMGDHVELHHVGSIAPGAGRQLVRIAHDYARAKKKDLQLEPVDPARGFYEKLGFSRTKHGNYRMPHDGEVK